MSASDLQKELFRRAWKHIDVLEFAKAETALRQLIEITDPGESIRLWELNGPLAGVLNSLSRPSEGTEMYRRALVEARRAGNSHSAIGPARYMLANQYSCSAIPATPSRKLSPFLSGSVTFNVFLIPYPRRLSGNWVAETRHGVPRNARWTPPRRMTAEPT